MNICSLCNGKGEIFTPCPFSPDTEVECIGCYIPCVPVECDVCNGTGLVTNYAERLYQENEE